MGWGKRRATRTPHTLFRGSKLIWGGGIPHLVPTAGLGGWHEKTESLMAPWAVSKRPRGVGMEWVLPANLM